MSFACSHTGLLLWFITFLGIFGMIFGVIMMRAGYKSIGLLVVAAYMTAFAVRPMIVKALTPSCVMHPAGGMQQAAAKP
jgi:hypothetical protein